jgi:DNA-binding response OmpR family regulator
MGRVLVVDDEPMVLDLMSIVLEEAGFEVWRHATGKGAMATLAEQRPDVLVTDVLMAPMDGVSLAGAARAAWPGLPVVFVSGYAPAHLTIFRRENPDAAFLHKPFDPEQLVGAVRSVLRRG